MPKTILLVYVDASDSCNDLVFQLGANGRGTNVAPRSWSIKVTQYSCDYNNLAPDGCTQYFFGPNSQTVQTYNYDGGYQLADQNQNICIRRERNICRLCWTTQAAIDFALSGATSIASGFNLATACCGYGPAGSKTTGFDCVQIPGAQKMTGSTALAGGISFCGRSQGLVSVTTGGAIVPATICSEYSYIINL